MKNLLFNIFVFFVLLIYGSTLFGIEKKGDIVDTLSIKAIEISKIDYKIKIAIDNHLRLLKQKNVFLKQKNNLIWIIIEIPFPKIDDSIDSILYANYNYSKFKNFDFEPSFLFGINLTNKNSRANYSKLDYTKYYYYDYNGWDVLFITNLPIEFETYKKEKTFSFQISPTKETKKYENEMSVYEIDNFTVYKKTIKRIYYSAYGKEYLNEKINKRISRKYNK
ncbi:MAG: hypothetical protein PHR79_06545 [Bacteroidales bacterium]|nr:hypothetical protein [Bacteroidales bacterium]